uniref:Type IV pilus assembly protein PilM n=1 Tax=Schlesneria paludicola TaxID=360056 RepID=A0A7C2JYM9_9PLAN
MWKWRRHPVSPIGVHLGQNSAALVQLMRTPAGPAVSRVALGSWTVDDRLSSDDQLRQSAMALRKLVQDHRFIGRRAVSCLGTHELFVQNMRVPHLSQGEVDRVVGWEAEERLPYPRNEAEIRHVIAGEVREDDNLRQEVILLACHRGVIQRHIALMEQAGLEPVGLDAEPCAWLRALNAGRPAAGLAERQGYLSLGERVSTVLFADREQILFIKPIPLGGNHFDQQLAAELGLRLEDARQMRSRVFAADVLDADHEVHQSVLAAIQPALESIASEVELCLRYFRVTFRGRPLDQLTITGEDSAAWLAPYLSQRLGLPCRIGNPFEHLSPSPTSSVVQHRPARWATSLGLSLRTVA